MRIREAAKRDLPRILEIERLSFDHPWSLESFLRELSLPFSRLVVAAIPDDSQLLAGFLCRWLVGGECHILNVAVHPQHRRLSVGAELIDWAIAEARTKQTQLVTLEVRRSNVAARGLYRKFNFEERRLRRNYYGPGEDAIVMELRLQSALQRVSK
jgi:ribosomal-protein-alanine N-acetyltransferase